MKKLNQTVTILLFLFFATPAHSQVKQDAQGNFYQVKDTANTGKPTGKVFTTTKGEKFPVFITAKGKFYVMRISKKTGSQYKQYLKID